MSSGTIGQRLRRNEDPRLLAGSGKYVGDIALPGRPNAATLRSPHAHARIRAIDLEKALAQPGVIAAAAFPHLGSAVSPIPCGQYPGLHSKGFHLLAGGEVRA